MKFTRREMIATSVAAGCALALPAIAKADNLQKYYHTLAVNSFKDSDRIKDNSSLKNNFNLLQERHFQCVDFVLDQYLNAQSLLNSWSLWEAPEKPGSVNFFQVFPYTNNLSKNVPSKHRFKIVTRDYPIVMVTNEHNMLFMGYQNVLYCRWKFDNPEHVEIVTKMKEFILSDND